MFKKNIISKETAKKQLDIFFDCYDFDIDNISDETTKKNVQAQIDKIEKGIMLGRLMINSDGSITQKLKTPLGGDASIKELTYKTLSGEAKKGMDGHGETIIHKRVYSLMGVLCGMGEPVVSEIKTADLMYMEGIALFFLTAV